MTLNHSRPRGHVPASGQLAGGSRGSPLVPEVSICFIAGSGQAKSARGGTHCFNISAKISLRMVDFSDLKRSRCDLANLRHGDTRVGKRIPVLWRIRASFRLRRAAAEIARSGIFDTEWYLEQNPGVARAGIDPVLHYLLHGAAEGRDPAPFFSGRDYLSRHPDVAAAGMNPLLHYVTNGIAEGRRRYEGHTEISSRFECGDAEPNSCSYFQPQSHPPKHSSSRRPRTPSTLCARPIRVLCITHNLDVAGAPKSASEVITGLKRRLLISPVVASPRDGPIRAVYEGEGIPVKLIKAPVLTEIFSSLERYLGCLSDVASELELSNFDIVYANTDAVFWAIDTAELFGVTSIWNIRESESWKTCYGHLPHPIAERAIECFGSPYRVVFVAHSTRDRWAPIETANNFQVIHNGIDVARFIESTQKPSRNASRKKLCIDKNEICILLLGTLQTRKGQHDLIEALKHLPDETIRLLRVLLVGGRRDAYQAFIERLIDGLPPAARARVRLVPTTSETAMYWNAADVFCCTSRVESYPRVILEAMAKALPVVTTPVYGIREQVLESVNALFYNPGDVEGLAQHLAAIVRNAELRRRLGRGSQQRLGSIPSYKDMLDAYAEVFEAATSWTLRASA
jgi:glycosyltransferase involved in cell wall biosynthesis